MAVAVEMPMAVAMLWLLRLQSRDPLAAVNKAQLGVSSVGDQSLQEGLHSQPIDHQHICLGQQTRLFRSSLKVVGSHLGRNERRHLGPLPGHRAGKLRYRQDRGHHLRGGGSLLRLGLFLAHLQAAQDPDREGGHQRDQ